MLNQYGSSWSEGEDFCAEVHEGELLKELPGQLRTDIVSHVLRDIFDGSHLFAVSPPPSIAVAYA